MIERCKHKGVPGNVLFHHRSHPSEIRTVAYQRDSASLREAEARAVQADREGRARWGDAEWSLRVDLAACYRLVDLFGMSDLVSNHISVRLPGPDEHFLINPFGMTYEEMTASSMIRVDLDGKIIDNPNADYSINLAGYVVHSAVHAARPEVGCVIHTHTVAGMAISALECGLLPVAQASMRFGKVGYHDFEGIAVEPGERERMAANLGDADAMILRNHGLLVACPSVPQAFNTIYRLERACLTQWIAMSCNSPMRLPPEAIIRKANAQYSANVATPPGSSGVTKPLGEMEWPAMRRLLDRRDPSYRW